eukprot:CAMPEP_0170176492 /NCGR_PEP_ID=MMETSP0040_2-20121228/9363_1 /TAXON_ID=641309 /ORGANISM="Lotharella oceanica, Strain CCMP622" /LENGTH=112 /DNA_ID=CAMNT_0010418835 /DNA_START=278 /DNA_END=616 /DNA_ORIENTATION=+
MKANDPSARSALDRIKEARAYKRQNEEQKSATNVHEEDIREIEKRDENEVQGSQFGIINTALSNMKLLDERASETDRKAYELLKKLGIPSPEPFVDDSSLEFPSEEIQNTLK